MEAVAVSWLRCWWRVSQYLVVLNCTKHCLVLSTIHMVEMLLVCEPSARNVALPGGSSDATSSTFQSQCGSLSSQIICISSGDVTISPSRNYPRFSAHFLMNFSNHQLFFSSFSSVPFQKCNLNTILEYPNFSQTLYYVFWVCNCKAGMPVNIILRVM